MRSLWRVLTPAFLQGKVLSLAKFANVPVQVPECWLLNCLQVILESASAKKMHFFQKFVLYLTKFCGLWKVLTLSNFCNENFQPSLASFVSKYIMLECYQAKEYLKIFQIVQFFLANPANPARPKLANQSSECS